MKIAGIGLILALAILLAGPVSAEQISTPCAPTSRATTSVSPLPPRALQFAL